MNLYSDGFDWIDSNHYGDLTAEYIYIYYDGMPLTFSARNEKDEWFWCYSLGLNDEKNADMYLIIPVSCDNLYRFEAGKISFLDMITKQQNIINLVYWYFDDTFGEQLINVDEMDFLLPKQGIYHIPY